MTLDPNQSLDEMKKSEQKNNRRRPMRRNNNNNNNKNNNNQNRQRNQGDRMDVDNDRGNMRRQRNFSNMVNANNAKRSSHLNKLRNNRNNNNNNNNNKLDTSLKITFQPNKLDETTERGVANQIKSALKKSSKATNTKVFLPIGVALKKRGNERSVRTIKSKK